MVNTSGVMVRLKSYFFSALVANLPSNISKVNLLKLFCSIIFCDFVVNLVMKFRLSVSICRQNSSVFLY